MTSEAVEAPRDSTVEDVLSTEPVLRRVVGARMTEPADVDDVVHDCLERMLGAYRRLAPDAVLPYGVVTARNLVTSRARTAARRASRAHLIVDLDEPCASDDYVLGGEARAAMSAALAQLSPSERAELDRHAGEGDPIEPMTGATRARMARTRAKLRLEYLLTFRRVTLPTAHCRSVLLAISEGDTRRQVAISAGDHLVDCAVCGDLSEPLMKRSLALTAVAPPLLAVSRLGKRFRANPATSTAAAGAVAAAALGVAAAVHHTNRHAAVRTAATTHLQPPSARPQQNPNSTSSPSNTPPAGTGAIPGLSVNGVTATGTELRNSVGSAVVGRSVVVSGVVTHNGFWVGPGGAARAWVELVGPLKPLHFVKGETVSFRGWVQRNTADYASRVGVRNGTDAAELGSKGVHIDVSTGAITVASG